MFAAHRLESEDYFDQKAGWKAVGKANTAYMEARAIGQTLHPETQCKDARGGSLMIAASTKQTQLVLDTIGRKVPPHTERPLPKLAEVTKRLGTDLGHRHHVAGHLIPEDTFNEGRETYLKSVFNLVEEQKRMSHSYLDKGFELLEPLRPRDEQDRPRYHIGYEDLTTDQQLEVLSRLLDLGEKQTDESRRKLDRSVAATESWLQRQKDLGVDPATS